MSNYLFPSIFNCITTKTFYLSPLQWFMMLNGWKIVARTDLRTSMGRESTGETFEVLYHDSLVDAYDVHSILYSHSQDSQAFEVLHCDGLYEIDASAFRVSPPPSPVEVAMREQAVQDRSRVAAFFSKASEALHALPKKDVVQAVLDYAKANAAPERAFSHPVITFLDLGCGNGKRVLFEASKTAGECVGVDFHPPIYNDCPNASFYRSEVSEFLRTHKQRQVDFLRINADFFLGRLSDPDRTFLLEKIYSVLPEGGEFSFCETVAVAKKIVATLKMFPGVSVRALDYWQSAEWMSRSSAGLREAEKFLRTHPEYAQKPAASENGKAAAAGAKENAEGKKDGSETQKTDAAKTAPRIVPASMPIVVVAKKEDPAAIAQRAARENRGISDETLLPGLQSAT